jgi:hypothetical protein
VTTHAQLSSDEAKQVVLSLGTAINDEGFQTARTYVADDMEYEGPFGTRVGAEAYLDEIERLRLKFHIQRIFAKLRKYPNQPEGEVLPRRHAGTPWGI